jgi:transcriptional regulator with XRE-family HTH domain
MNVTLRDYQAIEGGQRNVTMGTVVALADALGAPLRVLFDPPTSREERRRGRPAKPGQSDQPFAVACDAPLPDLNAPAMENPSRRPKRRKPAAK